jgi:hypothetical protein
MVALLLLVVLAMVLLPGVAFSSVCRMKLRARLVR